MVNNICYGVVYKTENLKNGNFYSGLTTRTGKGREKTSETRKKLSEAKKEYWKRKREDN